MVKISIFILVYFILSVGGFCYAEESIFICGKNVKVGDKEEETLKVLRKHCSVDKDEDNDYGAFYYLRDKFSSNSLPIPKGYIQFLNGELLAVNKSWTTSEQVKIQDFFMGLFGALDSHKGEKALVSTNRQVFSGNFSSDTISFFFGRKEIQFIHNLSNGQSGYQVDEYLWAAR